MNNIEFYKSLHRLLETTTPVGFDCGRLCGAACCQLSPELPGMYLFPGEEALFENLPGFTISGTQLPGYGAVRLLSCEGTCDRALRPLSCRIFPLSPKIKEGKAAARLDPRGRPVCPLCHKGMSALSFGFVIAVEAVLAKLMDEPSTSGFISALSRHVDEYEKPLF